jgi:ankyrin repeat protein
LKEVVMSEVAGGSPATLNLSQQRKQAKDLLKAARGGDADAIARLRKHHSGGAGELKLAHAQLAIARENGFDSWPKLVKELEERDVKTIVHAITHGDAQTVRRMLTASPRLRGTINEPRFAFGGRAINAAAKYREVLDVLLDFGADVNARSDWANGPFGVLDYCDEPTARHLIEHRGAILTAHAAARLGWLDELRAIVDANPQVIHEKGGDGQRPLHQAKTPEIADFLLERGAEIDAKCVDQLSTPAQYALAERPDVCRRLLERGATPDIFMPARLGDVALAERLIAEDPNCVAARIRLEGYPRVHPFGIYNWSLGFFLSPHDVARKYGHHDVYEVLLAHSLPKVRFFDALMRNDRSAAEAARSSGLALTAQDHGMLAIAVFHESFDAAMGMLEAGFDPAAGGIDGGTALHAAAWVGNVKLVDAILKTKRVDVNAIDPTHGGTPLGWAAYGSTARRAPGGDYVGVIERLVAAGADAHRRLNKHGHSMVDSAEGNPAVQAALKRLGAV